MKKLARVVCMLAIAASALSAMSQTPVIDGNSGTDLMTFWNGLVSQNELAGNHAVAVSLTDASTVTFNATDPNLNIASLPLYTPAVPNDGTTPCPVAQVQPAGYGMYTCVSVPDGITTRTVNVAGLVTGTRFVIALNPLGTAAGAQTVNFGTGCTWRFSQSNVPMSGSTLQIPAWANWTYFAVFVYDGTNCIGTVVN